YVFCAIESLTDSYKLIWYIPSFFVKISQLLCGTVFRPCTYVEEEYLPFPSRLCTSLCEQTRYACRDYVEITCDQVEQVGGHTLPVFVQEKVTYLENGNDTIPLVCYGDGSHPAFPIPAECKKGFNYVREDDKCMPLCREILYAFSEKQAYFMNYLFFI